MSETSEQDFIRSIKSFLTDSRFPSPLSEITHPGLRIERLYIIRSISGRSSGGSVPGVVGETSSRSSDAVADIAKAANATEGSFAHPSSLDSKIEAFAAIVLKSAQVVSCLTSATSAIWDQHIFTSIVYERAAGEPVSF